MLVNKIKSTAATNERTMFECVLLLKYRTQANVNIVNLLSIKTENRLHSHKNAFMAPARKAFLVSRLTLHCPIFQYGYGFWRFRQFATRKLPTPASVRIYKSSQQLCVKETERESGREHSEKKKAKVLERKATRNKPRNWVPCKKCTGFP